MLELLGSEISSPDALNFGGESSRCGETLVGEAARYHVMYEVELRGIANIPFDKGLYCTTACFNEQSREVVIHRRRQLA
jgi:hypothetical protein